jgi:hypothetical protein
MTTLQIAGFVAVALVVSVVLSLAFGALAGADSEEEGE